MSRVTLKDVAARAGVSYQTVSKVLNNRAPWNDFMFPLIVISVRDDLFTLPLGLALLRGGLGENLQWNAILGGSLVTTIPMAIIFIFFQRYFLEGISYSGLKG